MATRKPATKAKHKGVRVAVRGKTWTKKSTIAADKFTPISRAILSVLSTKPMRFTELVQGVRAKLPRFEGSVAWYTIAVARELEVQGKLKRHEKPVLYSLP